MPYTPDLFWLTLTILVTALMWVPYILNRIREMGLLPAVKNPRPDGPPEANWAYRAECAHRNAVENLILFAPLVIIVTMTGAATAATATACLVYFIARVAHWAIYVAGIPFLRTPAFAVGWAVQIYLISVLL